MTDEERTKDFNDLHDQNLVNEAKTTESRRSTKVMDVIKALLLGLLTGFIVLLIWCAIAMLLEREFLVILMIGCIAIGAVIDKFLPATIIGALMSGFLCICAYVLYQCTLAYFGWSSVENIGAFVFYIILIGIFGAAIVPIMSIERKRKNTPKENSF
jgi:hypothetical protein